MCPLGPLGSCFERISKAKLTLRTLQRNLEIFCLTSPLIGLGSDSGSFVCQNDCSFNLVAMLATWSTSP